MKRETVVNNALEMAWKDLPLYARVNKIRLISSGYSNKNAYLSYEIHLERLDPWLNPRFAYVCPCINPQ